MPSPTSRWTGTVVVVGHRSDAVRAKVSTLAPHWAKVAFTEQRHQLGTGDAVAVGLTELDHEIDGDDAPHTVIVVPGDTPLLRAGDARRPLRHPRRARAWRRRS